MLLYPASGTNDIARATAFLGPINANPGHAPLSGQAEGWGKDLDDGDDFCLGPTLDGKPATAGNDLTLAFPDRNAARVRQHCALALYCGRTEEGAPDPRAPYSPAFHVAHARNPDGHEQAFVFHRNDAAIHP